MPGQWAPCPKASGWIQPLQRVIRGPGRRSPARQGQLAGQEVPVAPEELATMTLRQWQGECAL